MIISFSSILPGLAKTFGSISFMEMSRRCLLCLFLACRYGPLDSAIPTTAVGVGAGLSSAVTYFCCCSLLIISFTNTVSPPKDIARVFNFCYLGFYGSTLVGEEVGVSSYGNTYRLS